MISLRSYLNCDSLGIAAVWRSQPPSVHRLCAMTAGLLEQHVYAKSHFDPRGLIVAVEETTIVGFVHAGLEPTASSAPIRGLVSVLMVAPRTDAEEIAANLLREAERFLISQSARTLIAGAIGGRAPFYLGLYGGSSLPGVLADDALFLNTARGAGYVDHVRTTIFRRNLTGFRPPVDRNLLAMRRQYEFRTKADVPPTDRYEAAVLGFIERTELDVIFAPENECCETLTFWDVEPLASEWKQRAMGLLSTTCADAPQRGTLLTCFLGEALKQFQTSGIGVVEIQVNATDKELLDACRKLGFKELGSGVSLERSV